MRRAVRAFSPFWRGACGRPSHYTPDMNIPESRTGTWSSRSAFVWVAVGSCVGMGTLLRFPAQIQTFGAVPFLAAYLVCLVLMAWPILAAEWGLGRWMRGELVSGFANTASAAGLTRKWRVLGAVMVVTAALVLSYYSVIAGWGLAYLMRAIGGVINAEELPVLVSEYQSLVMEPERGLSWHTLFMVATCVVVVQGFRAGVERLSVRLIPGAMLVAACLVIVLLMRTEFRPDWALLLTAKTSFWDLQLWLTAVREAFITAGLGLGAMMTLGAYLPSDVRLLPTAALVIGLDVLFGILMTLALFLLCGTTGGTGFELVFIGLPQALPPGLPGVLIGTTFYGLLVAMSLTSAVVLLEVVSRFSMERWRHTRIHSVTTAAAVIWALGVASLLSFSGAAALDASQFSIFDALMTATAQLAAPVSALMVCLFAGRLLPPDLRRAVFGPSSAVGYPLWAALLRYPARVGAVIIVLEAMGVFGAIQALWF